MSLAFVPRLEPVSARESAGPRCNTTQSRCLINSQESKKKVDEKSDYTAVTLLDKWKFVKQTIADKRLTAGDLRCVVAIADCYNSGKGRTA